MESQHIRVPLYGHDPPPLGGHRPCAVDAKQLTALMVELILRGIEIFRPFRLSQ